VHSYAQTISQLYRQLQQNGYSVTDMCRIRDAYELAVELFSGYFQSSGKLLIAHVVGTASILASLRLPVEVVAAGLLHNVYWNGDFGDGRRGITEARREQVRGVVGKEVEQYLARFATLRLTPQTVTATRDELVGLSRLIAMRFCCVWRISLSICWISMSFTKVL
jgi:(p)ppGpp synthase/HD superfamily hydrolase